MLHPMHLVQGSEFKINLETDHIILRGSIDESAGTILRGSVVLDCRETTKVRSITLKFIGKVKVDWTEGRHAHPSPEYADSLLGLGSNQKHYREDKTIIEHEWSFMPLARKPYHFSEGHYKWDFELPLPGDLPETVNHPLGKVYYRLKAVVDRPTFSINYSAKKNLKVSRVLLPTSLELTQSVVIENVWTDKLSYAISVPSKVFSLGSVIPITFDLSPIAADLRVRSISCSLKEYITISAEGHTRTEGYVVKYLRDDSLLQANQWSKTELLAIPKGGPHLMQCDTANELIKLKHKLKFSVALINADGHISELRAAIPIIIATLSSSDDGNALPTYEDAWQTAPYDAETVARLIASGGLPRSVAIAIPNAAAYRARTSISEPSDDAARPDPRDPLSGLGAHPSCGPAYAVPVRSAVAMTIPNAADRAHTGPSDTDDNATLLEPLPWQGADLSRVPSYTTAIRSDRLYSFSGSLPTYDSVAVPSRSGC